MENSMPGFRHFGFGYTAKPDFDYLRPKLRRHGYRIQKRMSTFQQTLGHMLGVCGVPRALELAVDYSLNHEILNVCLRKKTFGRL